MVSLRKRTSQPSYTSLAGLEHISDGENGEGSGSGIGNPVSQRDDQSDDSMSSGRSSAFDPTEEDGTAKRGTGRKGRGKATYVLPKSGTGHDDEEEAFVPSKEEGSEPDELGADDDEPMDTDIESLGPEETTPAPKRQKQKQKEKEKPPTRHKILVTPQRPVPSYATIDPRTTNLSTPRPTGFSIPYGETMTLHPILQETIKKSAEVLAKGTKLNPGFRDSDKKLTGVEGFSTGPITPFKVVLQEDPKFESGGSGGGRSGVKVIWEKGSLEERKRERQLEGRELFSKMPLYAPWTTWQGEGWWKEMYTPDISGSGHEPAGGGKKGKGKGKEKDKEPGILGDPRWKLREEVDLGLSRIGRLKKEDLQILSREEARPYLPNGDEVVCHMGPSGSQEPYTFHQFTSISHGLEKDKYTQKFYAGGPIWGMDWCPSASASNTHHIAVSTLNGFSDQPTIGTKRPKNELGSIQIWSLDGDRSKDSGEGGGKMRCELVLCVEGGAAMEVKWLPLGARDEERDIGVGLPKLGILAAVQLDGSIAFYSVPQPASLRAATPASNSPESPVFLRVHPMFRLESPDATYTCMDWMTGTRLIAGLSNGYGIVYDILDALLGDTAVDDLLPVAYLPVGNAPVRAVAAARIPQSDNRGQPRWDSYPPYAVFSSYDGLTTMVDIRDPEGGATVVKERKPAMSLAWASQVSSPIIADADYAAILHKAFGGGKNRTNGVTVHRGGIWSISTSDFHTMTATGSADGSMKIGSYLSGFQKKKLHQILDHRIFEMDYDEHTNQYRMTEDFLPEALSFGMIGDRYTTKNQKLAPNQPELVVTPAWSVRVGVHKVAWNTSGGIRNAGWVCAGMACGLGRVDWIEGEFVR